MSISLYIYICMYIYEMALVNTSEIRKDITYSKVHEYCIWKTNIILVIIHNLSHYINIKYIIYLISNIIYNTYACTSPIRYYIIYTIYLHTKKCFLIYKNYKIHIHTVHLKSFKYK